MRNTRLGDAEFWAKALWAASITTMAQGGGEGGRSRSEDQGRPGDRDVTHTQTRHSPTTRLRS